MIDLPEEEILILFEKMVVQQQYSFNNYYIIYIDTINDIPTVNTLHYL